MSTKTLLTADELERMPDDDSVQIELDEGELITMPPAGEEHGNLEVETVFELKQVRKRERPRPGLRRRHGVSAQPRYGSLA